MVTVNLTGPLHIYKRHVCVAGAAVSALIATVCAYTWPTCDHVVVMKRARSLLCLFVTWQETELYCALLFLLIYFNVCLAKSR